MRRGSILALSALIAALSLAPWLAQASHRDPRDGDDTKGLLDVKRVIVQGREKPRWETRTYARWSVKKIWDRGFVFVYIDTFGDERFDYYALVRGDVDHMTASLWRDRKERKDREIGFLDAWRKDKRSVVVRIPLKRMNFPEQRLTYRWRVQTIFTGDSCKRGCFDFVPNEGAVEEPIPGREPTPTPTITITPTPTIT